MIDAFFNSMIGIYLIDDTIQAGVAWVILKLVEYRYGRGEDAC